MLQKLKNLELKIQLIGAFVIIGLISSTIVTLISVNKTETELIAESFNKLSAIQTIKKNQILSYFRERMSNIKVLSKNPFIIQAMKDFDEVFEMAGGIEEKKITGKSNGKYSATELYEQIHDAYHPVLNEIIKELGYDDLLFMSPDKGDASYTVLKKSDFGKRASDAESSLKDAWKGAAEKGKITVTDIKPYEPWENVPAQFIAAPIKDGKELVGVLVLQLSIESINKIMEERIGMGKTGETYLVGQDKLMRSDSSLDMENHSVAASFKYPDKGIVDTDAVKDALNEERDAKIILNYNGKSVLSAYSHVGLDDDLGFPFEWAIMSEVEESEVMEPVNAMLYFILIALLGVMGLVAVAAYFVSKLIGRDFLRMIRIAETISVGDFTAEVDADILEREDAVGQLGQALSKMTSNLSSIVEKIMSNSQGQSQK